MDSRYLQAQNEDKPDLFRSGSKGGTTVGTLGRCKAQWQTALGVVMAAGLDLVIKLAAIV